MGLLGKGGDVKGDSGGVHGGFKKDDIALLQIVDVTIEGQLLETCDAIEKSDHSMTAVVTVSHGDATRVEKRERSMEG